ncbi:MAG: hypothetical protein ABI556_16050 [Gemmatimonadales bacterium]
MLADSPALQDAGIAKIKALLTGARPGLIAGAKELGSTMRQPLHLGAEVPNRGPAFTKLADDVKALRTKVMATAVEGSAALNAKDLAARALLETEQALSALADSYTEYDEASRTKFLAESVRLLKAAKVTGTAAGKALGIPWPLQ